MEKRISWKENFLLKTVKNYSYRSSHFFYHKFLSITSYIYIYIYIHTYIYILYLYLLYLLYIIYIALHNLLQSVLIKHFTKSLKRSKKGIPYSQALRLNRKQLQLKRGSKTNFKGKRFFNLLLSVYC